MKTATTGLSLSLFVLSGLLLLASCTAQPPLPADDDTGAISMTSASTGTISKKLDKSIIYSVDHGKHQVTTVFHVGLDEDGIIRTLSLDVTANDHESERYNARFAQAAQTRIIGKKIAELSLSAIGGASDTTDAFVRAMGSN